MYINFPMCLRSQLHWQPIWLDDWFLRLLRHTQLLNGWANTTCLMSLIMYLVPTPLFSHILISPNHEQLMYAMVYIEHFICIWSTPYMYIHQAVHLYMEHCIYIQMGHSICSFDTNSTIAKKKRLFWQLHFSRELQQLTWFMGWY